MGSKIKTKRWFRSRCLYNINSGASINYIALIIERSGDAHPQSGTVPGKISLSDINFRDRLIQLAQTKILPQILQDGTAENYPKSWNTERRKITPNLERRNGGKSLQILKDRTINTVFSFGTFNGLGWGDKTCKQKLVSYQPGDRNIFCRLHSSADSENTETVFERYTDKQIYQCIEST